MGNTLLTTEVLGLGAGDVGSGSGRNVVEELTNPLGQLTRLDTVGDNGEVGGSVGGFGEVGDSVGVEVLAQRGGGRRRSRDTETAVEGKTVGGVDGHLEDVTEEVLLGELDVGVDLLVVDVRGVLGLGSDLGEELNEVGKVVSEELCADNEVLAGARGVGLRAHQLGLALDAEGGALVGALYERMSLMYDVCFCGGWRRP